MFNWIGHVIAHKETPTQTIQRDLELADHLEQLGRTKSADELRKVKENGNGISKNLRRRLWETTQRSPRGQ